MRAEVCPQLSAVPCSLLQGTRPVKLRCQESGQLTAGKGNCPEQKKNCLGQKRKLSGTEKEPSGIEMELSGTDRKKGFRIIKMEILELENIYNGIGYVQSAVLGAAMLSLTLKTRRGRKKSILLWAFVVICAFLAGILSYFAVSKAGYRIMEAANGIEEIWKLQMFYSLISVMNVLEGSVAAVILCAASVWIYEGRRNIKIFVSVLFMLVFSSVFYVYKQIMYSLFSSGMIDEVSLSRVPPDYGMRFLIDCAGMAILFVGYRYLFRDKLVHILELAEEQICQIVMVPLLSYILFLAVRYTMDTYGVTLRSTDAGTFLMALIITGSLLLIYLLMFWAIFRAILASASSAKVKAELDVASKIQLSALPVSFDIGKEKGVDIFANMHPAKEVGGDFYDFFFVDEDHLAVLIADVSGKGVPAALFMMGGRAMIRNQLLLGLDPSEILKRSNNELAENNKEGMFITAFLGILDVKSGHFSYSNAGHNVPFLCHEGGDVEPIPVRHGFVLAGMKNIRYRTQELDFVPGDKLVLYTDGVTEATNAAYEMYEEKRLTEVLRQSVKEDVEQTVRAISESIDAFVDGAEQADDITMVIVKWKQEDQHS